MTDTTYVTQPFLPPLEELQPYLEKIWANRQLTNCGPLHEEFEEALGNHLGVDHVSLFANGTLALLAALQAAELSGTIQPGQTLSRSFLSSSDAMLVDGRLSLSFEEDANNGEPDFRFGFDGPATAWVVVPEPATVGVVLLGGLLLRRRRR